MKKTRITIVEDDHCMASMMYTIINGEEGFEVTDIFSSAEEALSCINDFTSDLIICDIKLSTDVNGYHCAERLRKFVSTPIMFYSNSTDQELIQDCLSFENTTYMPKTCPISELLDKIKEISSTDNVFRYAFAS